MYFEDTRLYDAITLTPFHKVAERVRELTEGGRDINIRSSSERTYLHLVAENGEKFNDPRALPAVYALALAGVDPRAKDNKGDTCLHVLAKQRGEIPPWRLLIALLRCGADPLTKNDGGNTAEELFHQCPHFDITLHFFKKYGSGLWNECTYNNPDTKLVENLARSWFRVKLHHDGKMVSMATAAEKKGAGTHVVTLLHKYEQNNELALATLAGSTTRMKKLLQDDGADINTRDHMYQYYHPRCRDTRHQTPAAEVNMLVLEDPCSSTPNNKNTGDAHASQTDTSTDGDDGDVIAIPVAVVAEEDYSDEIPEVESEDPSYHHAFGAISFPMADPAKFPTVPQPLVAAAWEQENDDVIDLLMSHKPDVSSLYVNQEDYEPKPLFYHTLCGRPRPKSRRIIHRIVRAADLARKDTKGKTILWEAIVQHKSRDFIHSLLDYGVDLAARDYKGRTARDYAATKGREEYVPVIDAYVLGALMKRDREGLEGWVYRAYDHILDLLKSEDGLAQKVVHKLGENRLYRELAGYIETIPSTQQTARRLYRATDGGEVKVLKHFATPALARCKNKCGHSFLHRALLTRNHDVIELFLEKYPQLVTVPDNMLRTPLHYCYLLYGKDHPLTAQIIEMGASCSDKDVREKTPENYLRESLSTHEYQCRLVEVTEYESRILLREMDFDSQLASVIKSGSVTDLKELMNKAGKNADLSRYSQWLFMCVDQRQPELATALIKYGCDPDVWRQEKAKPRGKDSSPPRVVSIHEHAKQCGLVKLANFIEKARKNKTKSESNAFEQMAYFEGVV